MPIFEVPSHVTAREAINSLRSTKCPACCCIKGIGKSLCRKCFSRLPGKLKQALYQRIGQGYEETLVTCLNFLISEE